MKEEANNVFSDAVMRGWLLYPNTKTGSLSYLFFNFSCARQVSAQAWNFSISLAQEKIYCHQGL